jgi:1-acyl-sn-glycerol-3-phosphate acyltransferase
MVMDRGAGSLLSWIDRFDPHSTRAFAGYDPHVAAILWSMVARVVRRWNVQVEGLEHLPPGGALLVMNHAFGWDAMLPIAAIRHATGRRVWALGEHLGWDLPVLRRLAAAAGVVDGTQENVDVLLRRGELVLVLPGGLREALKPRELRYRLLWGRRYGFVRAALRAGVPLIPLAGIGADEVFDLVGDAYQRGRRLLGIAFPLPRPAWGIPLPHPRRLRYLVGGAVATRPTVAGESEEATVRRLRREIRGALEELIDDALAARMGLATG